MIRSRVVSSIVTMLALLPGYLSAQPTYKLEVKPNLRPLVELKLDGTTVSRGELKDDPGLRLHYKFSKDGKLLSTIEGRSNPTLEIPDKTAGTYSVVLELFYPTYKTGDEQKGQFRPISNE